MILQTCPPRPHPASARPSGSLQPFTGARALSGRSLALPVSLDLVFLG